MGYALKVTSAAVEAVTGESSDEITPAVASSSSLRTKFSGASLRSRPKSGRLVPQGNGWVLESAPGSPAFGASPYGTPVSASFPTPGSPYAGSPGPYTGSAMGSQPGTPSGVGLGFPPSAFGPNGGGVLSPPPPMSARSSSGLGPGPRTPSVGSPRPLSVGNAAGMGGIPSAPGTPQYGVFPPTPGPGAGFNVPPPPQGKRMSMNGGAKKED